MVDSQPIFQTVFGNQWDSLPPALKAHYANRPYTNDIVTHEGALTITLSPVMRSFAWLMRLANVLVPFEGADVPCTVYARSDPKSAAYILDRRVFAPGREPYTFRSELVCLKPHVVAEYFRFGGGWVASYYFEGDKVILRHRGFAWRLFGLHIPLPGFLDIIFGQGSAYEITTGKDSFRMATSLDHFLHEGSMAGYAGEFRITEVKLAGKTSHE